MAMIGNIIWWLLGGPIYALVWLPFAGIFYIVGARKISQALMNFAKFTVLPFGKTFVKEDELYGNEVSEADKKKNKIMNLIWLPFGIVFTLTFFVVGLYIFLLGLLCFVTIIFIPVGIAFFAVGPVFIKFSFVVVKPIGVKFIKKEDALVNKAAFKLEEQMKKKAAEEAAKNQ